jgi:hypothetical protein
MNPKAKPEICGVNLTSSTQNLRTLSDDELDLVSGGDLGGLALQKAVEIYQRLSLYDSRT